jgi:hypothetical protein
MNPALYQLSYAADLFEDSDSGTIGKISSRVRAGLSAVIL